MIGVSATSDVKEPMLVPLMVSGMQACGSEPFPKRVEVGGPCLSRGTEKHRNPAGRAENQSLWPRLEPQAFEGYPPCTPHPE